MVDNILYFIETPLVRIAFILLAAGICIRSTVFVFKILITQKSVEPGMGLGKMLKAGQLVIFSFIPYHRAFLRQPIYTLVRYIFHLCLFIAPVWYTTHVFLLSDSILEWYWEPLADTYVDMMTLIVLGLGLFFLFRRLFMDKVKQKSSAMDYTIIGVTLMPYATGFLIVNHTLDAISFGPTLLWYLHVISGSAMMIMAAFLFVRTRLLPSRCVGCASCTISCPTGTLEAVEQGTHRHFLYSHYQCICCGACVTTCPEDAAHLRHEIGLCHFFSFFGKKKINEVVLNQCAGCHEIYAPDPQMEKISRLMKTKGLDLETLPYCNRCKKLLSHNKPLPRKHL